MKTTREISQFVLDTSVNLVSDVMHWVTKDREVIQLMVIDMYEKYNLRNEHGVSHRRNGEDVAEYKTTTSRFEGVAYDKVAERFVARTKGKVSSGGNELLIKHPDELVAAAAFLQWYRENQGWAPAPRPVSTLRLPPVLLRSGAANDSQMLPPPSEPPVAVSIPRAAPLPALEHLLPTMPAPTPGSSLDGVEVEELLNCMLDLTGRLAALRERRADLLRRTATVDRAIESTIVDLLEQARVVDPLTKVA